MSDWNGGIAHLSGHADESDMPSGCGTRAWNILLDELIDKTRREALSQIGEAKAKTRRYNLKLLALIFCWLLVGVYVWVKL
jgi:hypothetical protein